LWQKLTSVDVDIDEDVYGEREWVNAKDVMSIKEKMKSLLNGVKRISFVICS